MNTNDNPSLAEILARFEKMEAQIKELIPLARKWLDQRERTRLRVAKRRSLIRGVRVQGKCTRTREKGKEKQNLPPTPPIREKESPKERVCVSLRAREEMFNAFWTEYPDLGMRKRLKKRCQKAFDAILEKADDEARQFNAIMSALRKWKQTREWGAGYVCAPLTWLTEEYWLIKGDAVAPRPLTRKEQAEKEIEDRRREEQEYIRRKSEEDMREIRRIFEEGAK